MGEGLGVSFLSFFLLPHPQHTHEYGPSDFLPSFLSHCHSQSLRGSGTQVAPEPGPTHAVQPRPRCGEGNPILLLKGLRGSKAVHSEQHNLLPKVVRPQPLAPYSESESEIWINFPMNPSREMIWAAFSNE